MGQAAETESTLALAENVYINLPTPNKNTKLNFDFITVIKQGPPPPQKERQLFLVSHFPQTQAALATHPNSK